MSPTQIQDGALAETLSSRIRARCSKATRIREQAADVNDPVLAPLRLAMKRRASELELEAHVYAAMGHVHDIHKGASTET
jgi:hypothetical protein